jgi:hypothetical protein
MTVLIVRYQVREECVDDVSAGIEQMIAALGQEQPKGVRYALGRLLDGVTFVGLLELAEGVDNPLPGIAAARDFQQKLPGWVVGDPPVPAPMDVVGSYDSYDSYGSSGSHG